MIANDYLSIYGSHDASVTFIDLNGAVRVYEYERFVKKRYAMFSSQFDYRTIGSNSKERRAFINLIYKNLQNKNIKTILYAQLNEEDLDLLREFFPLAGFKEQGHHVSHAYSGVLDSKFENCIVLSVDGGGVDDNIIGTTEVYEYKNNNLFKHSSLNIDLGNAYSSIGYLISEIKHGGDGDENNINSLVYAGKVMGLSAYGNIKKEWVEFLSSYYDNHNLDLLCSNLKILNCYNSISGQLAYDLAATSQFVFEQKMWNIISPFLDFGYKNFIFVGGCALNVLFNQKFKKYIKEVNGDLFIPCHPNDCGLSFGMFVKHNPEIINNFNVYNGLEITDLDKLNEYQLEYKNSIVDMQQVVDLLKNGKIIGILRGNSEIGPRALGNRSIICLPTFENMKEILNLKVKFREWYRPFAPVCQEQDMNEYFIDAFPSPYMSYAPFVNKKYKSDLLSITHIDDTARLQTITKESNSFLFNLLDKLKENNLVPVILNTSFNIRGKPILSSLEDAFYVLKNTELDNLIIEDTLFIK